MKRQLLFFVIVMILCGTAWGQTLGHEDDDDDWYHWRDYMPGMGHRGRVNLNVVPRLSTGARNSAGLFRSYTDNFIDPRFYCRDIDTFFFVGANIPYENRHVNAGFARSFNSLYLALYYGGGFVRGYRERRGEDTAEYLPNEMERETSWKNNLALLLGFGEAMGIRLDVAVHSETIRMARRGSMGGPGVTEDNLTQIRFNYGPSFALTWGARFGSLAPWARVGYRVPNLHLSDYETSQHGTRISNYSRLRTGGAMEISGGARFELGEVSSIGGEIWLGNTFPDRLDRSHSSPGSVPPNYNVTDRRGGMTGFGLGVYSMHLFGFGFDDVKLGFSPNLNFGITSISNSWEGDTGSFRTFGDRFTTLDMGVDLGINWQVTQRIALFAGAKLRAFDWTTWAQTGEKHYRFEGGEENLEARLSKWVLEGVRMEGPAIGVTFSPMEDVVIGLAMNSFIDGLFGNGQSMPTFDFTVSARIDRW